MRGRQQPCKFFKTWLWHWWGVPSKNACWQSVLPNWAFFCLSVHVCQSYGRFWPNFKILCWELCLTHQALTMKETLQIPLESPYTEPYPCLSMVLELCKSLTTSFCRTSSGWKPCLQIVAHVEIQFDRNCHLQKTQSCRTWMATPIWRSKGAHQWSPNWSVANAQRTSP